MAGGGGRKMEDARSEDDSKEEVDSEASRVEAEEAVGTRENSCLCWGVAEKHTSKAEKSTGSGGCGAGVESENEVGEDDTGLGEGEKEDGEDDGDDKGDAECESESARDGREDDRGEGGLATSDGADSVSSCVTVSS